MISIKQKGNFSKFDKYLEKIKRTSDVGKEAMLVADRIVDELAKATPKDTGLTANSWGYTISQTGKKVTITFLNKNLQNGLNVALLLEYGHGTPSGRWVEGKQYIDPVIRKNYLDIINNAWKEMIES
ncbi:MAG: HK97 gp10 family phage protein [Acholeplasmatales bacterium]|nr:HK97 gp10 family phage protein [Acholeplasmatales bacterium]